MQGTTESEGSVGPVARAERLGCPWVTGNA
jgi:hypothetical protein